LSTHILPEVTMVCGRVLIINRGRIVAQDTMANLARGTERSLEEVFIAAVARDVEEDMPAGAAVAAGGGAP
jgi:ABC-type Na+ transport system ATPase subunit NatA